MKNYTVRFRCRSHLEDDDTVNEEQYEMQIEAENLKEVFSRLDDQFENWDHGAVIPLNTPGGEMTVETVEILNPNGEVLY